MIAACARAIPRSSSARCCAVISICVLPSGGAGDGSIPAMFDWKRPDNLGVKDGRLAPPKRSPNCVSSQGDPQDREHYVQPIAFGGSMDRLKKTLLEMQGATLVDEKPDYLYAEFRSKLLGFVDDFELLQQGGVLHVRSASRLGRRDFGVNRKRVEALRKLLS